MNRLTVGTHVSFCQMCCALKQREGGGRTTALLASGLVGWSSCALANKSSMAICVASGASPEGAAAHMHTCTHGRTHACVYVCGSPKSSFDKLLVALRIVDPDIESDIVVHAKFRRSLPRPKRCFSHTAAVRPYPPAQPATISVRTDIFSCTDVQVSVRHVSDCPTTQINSPRYSLPPGFFATSPVSSTLSPSLLLFLC